MRALERINLNVAPEVRERLRAIAKRLDKSESEMARQLLQSALDDAEKDLFYRRAAEATTLEVRERMLTIHDALETLDT